MSFGSTVLVMMFTTNIYVHVRFHVHQLSVSKCVDLSRHSTGWQWLTWALLCDAVRSSRVAHDVTASPDAVADTTQPELTLVAELRTTCRPAHARFTFCRYAARKRTTGCSCGYLICYWAGWLSYFAVSNPFIFRIRPSVKRFFSQFFGLATGTRWKNSWVSQI